jgi:hypothetical protein
LFDAGLNPLTEVPFAGARTDIVDPSLSPPGFLIEAKQYGDGVAPATAVRAALGQALDTAQRLHGTYEVDEVFIVVSRREGRISRLLPMHSS